LKNSGIGNGAVEWGKARLVPEADGTVSLYNGYTEMGQGLLTVLAQFASEVTGLPTSIFRPKVDSTFALGCAQTTGSRATLFGGNAVVSRGAPSCGPRSTPAARCPSWSARCSPPT
jgi:CO/xanthine dehydrogenase Mo-binding subunit